MVTYTVSDGVDTATATLSLTVTPVNDAPTTTPVTLTAIAEDSGARTITQSELLGNSSDVENNTRVASGLTITSGSGTLVDNGNGTWTYTPAANDDSAVSFSYTITDNGTTNGVADGKTVGGTATLDITAVNDAPTTTAVTLTAIAEDSGARTITQAELLVNSSDVENDTRTVSNVSIATGTGTLVDNGNGTWTYTPAANDDTSVSFSYTITDNGTTNGVADGKTVGGTATLDITPVNDAPSGADATLSVARNGSQALGVGDFGFSDTENNGFLAVKITQLPTAGTLTLAGVAVTVDQVISAADIAAGKLVFAPALNAAGTGYANIKFAVQDDGGTANGGIDLDASSNTITFNVTGGGGGGGGGGGTGGNTVPVAANDSGSGLEDAVR